MIVNKLQSSDRKLATVLRGEHHPAFRRQSLLFWWANALRGECQGGRSEQN